MNIVPYHKFRAGLSFLQVRQMLWSPSEDSKDWPHVTRHTVLGKWRQIKLEMYDVYLREQGIEDRDNYDWLYKTEKIDLPF